jgi:hypothetical protein
MMRCVAPLTLAFALMTSSAQADEAPSAPTDEDPLPAVLPWVIGGFGAAAILAGGALLIAGHVEKGNATDTCAPYCHPDVQDSIRTKWIAGGLSMTGGVIVTAAAAMTYAILNSPDSKVDVAVSSRGVAVSWQLRF